MVEWAVVGVVIIIAVIVDRYAHNSVKGIIANHKSEEKDG